VVKKLFASRNEMTSRPDNPQYGRCVALDRRFRLARATASFALLSLANPIPPFLLWNVIIGFVVYLHHTGPKIAWFQNRQEWQRRRAYLTSTACVRLPLGIDSLMHSIMEHNAHHLNPRISMFTLRAAQRALQENFPELSSYCLNRHSYMDSVRRCKLYDYANHAWLDFSGRVTARVPFTTAVV
jgi:omega-6 fatty acid desaturase (delta-12 desaturase)